MYETPPHLLDRQRHGQKNVRSLGIGFTKAKLDQELHERLRAHLRSNVHNFVSEPPSDYLLTDNKRAYPSLLYQNEEFNQQLMADLHAAHEKWCGIPIKKAACYGIRVYQPGSYLYNHVDHTNSHVVSSTICVDHRLNGPWPLCIEDDDGHLQEVTIEPGEMVFFEGARLIHGRPYPLDGEFYANIFVHYTPLDWDLGAPSEA
jgi:prolyl 4-hydroxylase